MRTTIILSLTGFGLLALSAPVLADDITIAVAGPMTGPVASIGEQMKRGAEAAAAAINDGGGVDGRKIKIVIEDDACDPKQAVTVANLIVGQQIKYVDGHACSGSSIPASDVYAENDVLMMSPASSNPALTEKGHATIMRLYPRDDRQGEFIAPWIADRYKGKKIAILHDKSAYGKGLASVVKDKLNAGGVTEVMFEGINPGEKDYTAVITKLKSAGAEFVYFGGYHAEAGLILRQAADQGAKFQLMTGDSIATSEFWAMSGQAGEGTLANIAIERGLTEEKLLATMDFETSSLFDERERAALRFASRFKDSDDGIDSDQVYDELKAHFSEEEIIELALLCAQTDGVGKFARSLKMRTWEEACALQPKLRAKKKDVQETAKHTTKS